MFAWDSQHKQRPFTNVGIWESVRSHISAALAAICRAHRFPDAEAARSRHLSSGWRCHFEPEDRIRAAAETDRVLDNGVLAQVRPLPRAQFHHSAAWRPHYRKTRLLTCRCQHASIRAGVFEQPARARALVGRALVHGNDGKVLAGQLTPGFLLPVWRVS